jgi:hypothetical protein
MPKLTHSAPKYRLHKASGQAVVTLNRTDHCLGPWKSKVGRVEYDRGIGEMMANCRRAPQSLPGLSAQGLCAEYRKFAERQHVKDGRSTGTMPGIRVAIRFLRRDHGFVNSADFGPLGLKAL